jgi:hypothetical protein
MGDLLVPRRLARLRWLALLAALHCVDDDPGTEPKDRDSKDHLPHDDNAGPLGRRGDIAEPNRCEHGYGEVQRVGTRQWLAETASVKPAQDEIGRGEEQQKQWNARSEGFDRP